MSEQGRFLVYVIEAYGAEKGMSSPEVVDYFNGNRVLEYVYAYFDALHTTGELYIIEDIDAYIESRKGVVSPR